MNDYEVWATRWDDPHTVEDIVPARRLSFNLPLSDHGECSFTATVEPGRSDWRRALAPPLSGILITRDSEPAWCGWMDRPERQIGPRTFSFQAREWGAFFDRLPAKSGTWTDTNDHALFLEQIDYAQSVADQDVQVVTTASTGAARSDLTVNVWDRKMAGEIARQIANAEGGPEWYYGAAGTLADPVRQLVLGDRLGATDPVDVLMYVEDTEDWQGYGPPPTITLLSDLFPAGTTAAVPGRRGGNVVAVARDRDPSDTGTVAVAVGDGVEAAQLAQTATATALVGRGWPRLTRVIQHSSVTRTQTLARHARADLAAMAGVATRYGLVTLDGDPDWTQVPRGSTMRVVLDTDVYGGNRPHVFESRVQDIRVDVPDDGGAAQVTWDVREVLEVSL